MKSQAACLQCGLKSNHYFAMNVNVDNILLNKCSLNMHYGKWCRCGGLGYIYNHLFIESHVIPLNRKHILMKNVTSNKVFYSDIVFVYL